MGGFVSCLREEEVQGGGGGFSLALLLQLPPIILMEICTEWLSRREAVNAEQQFRTHYKRRLGVFQPYLADNEAAYAVVSGNTNRLIRALNRDPAQFFRKFPLVTDPAGVVYRNASAADLMDFLVDSDLLQRVSQWVRSQDVPSQVAFVNSWKKQRQNRGRGGIDLFKIIDLDFNITISALIQCIQNPDGLIYYRLGSGYSGWFYVNKEKNTLNYLDLDLVQVNANTEEYSFLLQKLNAMPPYTGRRSSDAEHRLFQRILRHHHNQTPVVLFREGLEYTRYETPLSPVLSALTESQFKELRYVFWNRKELIHSATVANYKTRMFNHLEILLLQKFWPSSLYFARHILKVPEAVPVHYRDTVYDFERFNTAYHQCFYHLEQAANSYLMSGFHETIVHKILQHLTGRLVKEVMWMFFEINRRNQAYNRSTGLFDTRRFTDYAAVLKSRVEEFSSLHKTRVSRAVSVLENFNPEKLLPEASVSIHPVSEEQAPAEDAAPSM